MGMAPPYAVGVTAVVVHVPWGLAAEVGCPQLKYVCFWLKYRMVDEPIVHGACYSWQAIGKRPGGATEEARPAEERLSGALRAGHRLVDTCCELTVLLHAETHYKHVAQSPLTRT